MGSKVRITHSGQVEKCDVARAELEKVTKAWPPISRAVRVPHSEGDYRELVELLDRVTDAVGEDENHPLASLMDQCSGVLIKKNMKTSMCPNCLNKSGKCAIGPAGSCFHTPNRGLMQDEDHLPFKGVRGSSLA